MRIQMGINMSSDTIFCANCKKPICGIAEQPFAYCPTCGAPLTIEAIDKFEENETLVKRDLLRQLNKIAKENQTDSLEAVLEVYMDDID